MAASPAIRVKLSRLYSQNSVLPPKPRSLIIERRKSTPYFSALRAISRLRSKLGIYCGEFSEISQPLLPIGVKIPTSIISLLRGEKRAVRRRSAGGAKMSDAGDLDQQARLHQPALDAVAGRLGAGKIFGIDRVHRRIVGPVGQEDVVERDVRQSRAGGLERDADGLQHMARLRRRVAGMEHRPALAQRQRPRDVDRVAGPGAGRIRRDR